MAIEDFLFPMQSLTSKAAMDPSANMMGMASSPFMVGGGGQQVSPFMGLAGLVNQYADIRDSQPQQQEQANTFASQTPGAPQQPGRIDQTSFGGQGGMADPISLLDQNINRRFGL